MQTNPDKYRKKLQHNTTRTRMGQLINTMSLRIGLEDSFIQG